MPTTLVRTKKKPAPSPEQRAARELKPKAVESALIEYHGKVLDLKNRMLALLKDHEAQAGTNPRVPTGVDYLERELLASKFSRLEVAGKRLITYSSGLVENSILHPFTKIQLWLRLAEFEAELLTAGKAFKQMDSAGLVPPRYN